MPRLYINQPLAEKLSIQLSPDQSHYLCHVLRQTVGDRLIVFNEINGDWLAILTTITKKQAIIEVNSQQRLPVATPPLWLAFAPLKQEATNMVLEKATELGVTHVQPLWMDHSNTQRLNQDRFQKIMIEAAEQCERQDIPILLQSLKLMAFLDNLPVSVQWFVALERSEQSPLLSTLQQNKQHPPLVIPLRAGIQEHSGSRIARFSKVHPSAFAHLPSPRLRQTRSASARQGLVQENLSSGMTQGELQNKQATWGFIIGPEGGFSTVEQLVLRRHPSIRAISLGPRVLRAETAALSVLAVAQSVLGS